MVLLGDEAQVKAPFRPFGNRLILMQDRCTVFAEHTISTKIVLHARNGLCQMYHRLKNHFGCTWWYS
jgi:hypothetical protein